MFCRTETSPSKFTGSEISSFYVDLNLPQQRLTAAIYRTLMSTAVKLPGSCSPFPPWVLISFYQWIFPDVCYTQRTFPRICPPTKYDVTSMRSSVWSNFHHDSCDYLWCTSFLWLPVLYIWTWPSNWTQQISWNELITRSWNSWRVLYDFPFDIYSLGSFIVIGGGVSSIFRPLLWRTTLILKRHGMHMEVTLTPHQAR